MSDSKSAPRKLFESTLARLTDELGLTEQHGEDGGPYMALQSHAPIHEGQCGDVRLLEGDSVARVVTCSLVAPAIFLDSHMVFAFTDADSPVPHFTLDSVKAAETFAFHLDLIPKADLGVNLPYMNWAFDPLTETHEQSYEIEGLTRAHITPLQNAVMSPWMLVNRADESAFESITPLVESYISHWLSVLNGPVPGEVSDSLSGPDIAARDAANRALIFNPEVDKVWNQISGLIGEKAVLDIRNLLMNSES